MCQTFMSCFFSFLLHDQITKTTIWWTTCTRASREISYIKTSPDESSSFSGYCLMKIIEYTQSHTMEYNKGICDNVSIWLCLYRKLCMQQHIGMNDEFIPKYSRPKLVYPHISLPLRIVCNRCQHTLRTGSMNDNQSVSFGLWISDCMVKCNCLKLSTLVDFHVWMVSLWFI